MALPEPDPQDLARARAGDRAAFGRIVHVYSRLIYNLAYRMTRSRAEADDLSQEIFLRMFRNLRMHDRTRPFGPWIYRLGHNLGVNFVTRRPPRPLPLDARDADDEGARLDPPARGPSAVEQADAAERAVRVRAAVRRLPPAQRAILTMHYFQGCSYEELAATLQLPLGTVKNRLFRAREALRDLLPGDAP